MFRPVGKSFFGVLAPTVVRCESDADVRAKHFGQWAPDWSRTWNNDWDFRHPKEEAVVDKKKFKTIHLIMVRHGQYDLKEKHLTALGREQAILTGKRISDMCNGLVSDHYGKRRIRVRYIHHSDLPRAAETAAIVASQLAVPEHVKVRSDGMLAEGWPCLPDSYRDADKVRPSHLFAESARIEAVFRKYCHRVSDHKKKLVESSDFDDSVKVPVEVVTAITDDEIEEEYVVLICHQNIIRYFVCRALQLPPEAWLRFRGSNCGITEIIISDDGRVALERFADVGHLPLSHLTFH